MIALRSRRFQPLWHVSPGGAGGRKFGLTARRRNHARGQNIAERRHGQKRAVSVPEHVALQVERPKIIGGVNAAPHFIRHFGDFKPDIAARMHRIAVLQRAEQLRQLRVIFIRQRLTTQQQRRMAFEQIAKFRVNPTRRRFPEINAFDDGTITGMERRSLHFSTDIADGVTRFTLMVERSICSPTRSENRVFHSSLS